MNWIATVRRQRPELALFLTLAIGYALGRIRIGSVQLGAVTGVLLVALWGTVVLILMARADASCPAAPRRRRR
ncbi:MAG: hypothetical protein ABW020_02930 [Candidatus Rokuibacteriota bacterium]